ncbi:ATP-grasp domain-containing protein [Streptomyces parvus]|uniref:ATP-grasp domain-containing protein n=1 Tax=Streptomyces parvus TaxID=66428 RepID=UPI0033C4DCEB
MIKETALFLNKHSYEHFDRGGRSLLPTSELDIHLVTRRRWQGGLDGFADHPLSHVTLCDGDDENYNRWRDVSTWILRHHPVSRIIAVHERAVLLAAELRSKFSLPGTDHETALLFRDKLRMKEAVQRSGAAALPAFSALDSPEDLNRVDWSTGRKVIKSRWGLAAKDVYMADSLDQARDVVSALDLSNGQFGIEEFIDGPIFHCDSVVVNGEIRFVSVGKYLVNPSAYSPGGVFGTLLLDDAELVPRIHRMNAAVLSALGLKDGTAHLELFRTPADELVFCEVASRPPGGAIPHIIEWQYGFNIVEAQIRIDAGLPVSLGRSTSAGTCGFLSFYPGGGEARGIPPHRFGALDIVEHIKHHGAGNGLGGVRHSTDFLDSYVVRAPDEKGFVDRMARIQDEYWQ